MSAEKFRPILLKQLRETWKSRGDADTNWLLVKVLQVLQAVRYVLSLVRIWCASDLVCRSCRH
ncbi:uncharacterized protein PHACADRAFT_256193 [Phanerochaete carnosa HHB-10118-sp]|uniref:Uncharacterized protein n=1 Tax=Phanerochaete carnosa (strain HHB-10118-sp) TaxID=650164 RepID=K5W962_PHACS|nr:uncharacterized protein PHACADRAFT_256193 [Phanerochaete carnosa HHB-10118-sp]EKM55514.1 hypothetical protein PHACADRAFT_256193 [Phanerochaete carnosa HHB-10118-sp]